MIVPYLENGSPSSSVQEDTILEGNIWKFATGADECESLFTRYKLWALPHIWGFWHCRAISSQQEVAGEATTQKDMHLISSSVLQI